MRCSTALLLAASVLFLSSPAPAEEDDGWITLPFTLAQVAIAPGYWQLFTKPTAVYGARLSVFYGVQSEVVGLDVGGGMQTDVLRGLAVGFCHVVMKDATGIQLGAACTHVEEELAGLQVGPVNMVRGELWGAQLGVANTSEGGAGLQIGLFNAATSMSGIQLGLVNLNDKGFLPVFPIINFGF